MIEIEGLKKRFGQSIALDEVSMHVRDGAMYGFVGPNGAGKTTTIRCMMGLLAADGGKLLINGIDMEKEPKKALSQIGYIPDDFGVYDNLKVLEYMEFFASCYGITGLSARKRHDPFRPGGTGGQIRFLCGQSLQRHETAVVPGKGIGT